MKRILIFASAAIVALASCAKTEVVYKDAPQEIAFKQITGAMTKTLVDLDANMGVFAYTVDTPAEYFDNILFANDGSGIWKASPAMFYPIQGALDFAYYSPHASGWTFNGSTTLKSPALADIKDTDVLYGTTIATSPKTDAALNVVLAHALAQVTVNVTTDEASKGYITIKEVILSNTCLGGTLTVTYVAKAASNAVWAADPSSSLTWTSNVLLDDSTDPIPYGQNYIIADYGSGENYEQGTLTVSYSMDKNGAGAGTETYEGTATFDLSTDGSKAYWNMGNNYIYNIKATLTEITFDADVEEFVDTPTAGTPVVL